MKKMVKNNKGFTLIELMIVVAIIGILAAIAIPNFMNYQCKAKQTEAKSLLGAIRTAQEAYYAEYSKYAENTGAMGFTTRGTGEYSFDITNTDRALDFTATATGTINGAEDEWTIDQEGKLTNIDGKQACN
jgi:type IV pilus assembly protein PilA